MYDAHQKKNVPVYNLEVEGDHVYRVGESGVLVHNMSQPAGGGEDGDEECEDKCEEMWGLPTPQGRTFILRNRTVKVKFGTPRPGELAFGSSKGEETVAVTDYARFRGGGGSIHVTGTDLEGTGTDKKVQDFVKKYEKKGDVAGHVIANDFGGPAYVGPNGNKIVPLNETVNASSWVTTLENTFRNLVKKKRYSDVCVQVTFEYDEDSDYPARPESFTVQFLVRPSPTHKWSLRNPVTKPND